VLRKLLRKNNKSFREQSNNALTEFQEYGLKFDFNLVTLILNGFVFDPFRTKISGILKKETKLNNTLNFSVKITKNLAL